MAEQAELLRRLAVALVNHRPAAALPLRLCAAYSELVGAEGGSIALDFASTHRLVPCATDDRCTSIEDAQEVLREGPSLDAYRTGTAVTGLTPADQRRRWPLLDELLETSFPGTLMHAFPMRPDGQVVGALLVYRTGTSELAMEAQEAQFLANAIAIALLGDLDSQILTDATWSSRDRVDQATGMVAAQLRVAPQDALAVLRAHAYAHSTTLAEVSSWVLSRDLTFTDRDSPDGSQT